MIYNSKDIPADLKQYFVRAELGLETTPDEYVAKLVSVFREVRRILRDDGTLWLNLGDSYSSNQSNNGGCSPKSTLSGGGGKYRENSKNKAAFDINRPRRLENGLKPKDLIGIPWRVALALQADGWYLRQDIIWHKPNPMPESVTDRCTKAHEYIFLLSKSERYYFDHEAIKEPSVTYGKDKRSGKGSISNGSGKGNADRSDAGGFCGIAETRNKRSVWTVTTKGYKGAHFAVFPPDLIEPCILAGSRTGDMVLDPFGGSGTTAGVALRHGRNALMCELSAEYAALMQERIDSIVKR